MCYIMWIVITSVYSVPLSAFAHVCSQRRLSFEFLIYIIAFIVLSVQKGENILFDNFMSVIQVPFHLKFELHLMFKFMLVAEPCI